MKNRSTSLLILLMVAALTLTACGGGGAPAPTATPQGPVGDATAGKQGYDSTCIACHGADAKGMPGLGKDLTVSEYVKAKSDADLVALIKVGRPASDPANTQGVDMPPKGGNPALDDQDILNVVAYLRSLQAP
jgi:disulfide bond formation protein DsbB